MWSAGHIGQVGQAPRDFIGINVLGIMDSTTFTTRDIPSVTYGLKRRVIFATQAIVPAPPAYSGSKGMGSLFSTVGSGRPCGVLLVAPSLVC